MTIKARFNIERGEFRLNVNLSIPSQGITALSGPSGSGKTTILRAIAGLEHYHNGFLRVGKMIWQDDHHCLPPHKRPLGYVFQEASLFTHLSVKRNLDYGIKRVPKSGQKIALEQAIELLGIEQLLQRKPETLSGGERQRVAIARALSVSPSLLLMDEPLASLDHSRKQEILPYIESLHHRLDIPIIYVSHSPDEVARLADHMVLLDSDGEVATGTIQHMLTRLDLPIAHDRDAETLIEATVTGHDDEYDLTYLEFAGGRFTVGRKDLSPGTVVRLRIAARDVSLTLAHQSGTSILNIFPATVDELIREGKYQMTVRLLLGDVVMLARLTRKSASILDLKPGKQIFAQAKSVALLS